MFDFVRIHGRLLAISLFAASVAHAIERNAPLGNYVAVETLLIDVDRLAELGVDFRRPTLFFHHFVLHLSITLAHLQSLRPHRDVDAIVFRHHVLRELVRWTIHSLARGIDCRCLRRSDDAILDFAQYSRFVFRSERRRHRATREIIADEDDVRANFAEWLVFSKGNVRKFLFFHTRRGFVVNSFKRISTGHRLPTTREKYPRRSNVANK